MGWDQKGDKRASEGAMPDFLHFPASWVTGMGGPLPKAHPERTSCDSQPLLLPRLNPPLLSPGAAAEGEVAAPNVVFCPCGSPVCHLVKRAHDICVNIMSSNWKFL